jgi:hypothetical protein
MVYFDDSPTVEELLLTSGILPVNFQKTSK